MAAKSTKEELRCGEDLIGYVAMTGCDHYWILGSFTPGRDYEKYRPLFEQERELSRRADASSNGPEGLHDEHREAWEAALEAINELGLTWGDPGRPIRDVTIDERSQVGFRPDA
jgi:hypothetical protein